MPELNPVKMQTKRIKWLWIALLIVFPGRFVPAHAGSNAAVTFFLEQTRTGTLFGPFEMREGAPIDLGDKVWRLRLLSRDQVAFEHPGGQLREGPYAVTPGRLIELDGRFYTIQEKSDAPVDIADPSVALPPPVMPRRWAPVQNAWPAPIGDMGFQRRDQRLIGLRLEPWSRISMGWDLGGGGGTEGGDLTERSMGLRIRFKGWETALDRIYDSRVRDTPVETGFEIAALRIENGNGWRGEIGYGFDLYRESNWSFGLSAQVGHVHRNLELATTRLKPQSTVVSNGTVSVAYAFETETSPFALRETYLQAGPELRVEYGLLGCEAGIQMLLFSRLSPDAHLDTSDGQINLDAKRRHPVSGRVTFWRWFGPFRVCAGMIMGGTLSAEAGVDYRW